MTRLTVEEKMLRTIGERELLGCIRQLASATGWLAYHTWSSRFSEKGFPDLTLVRKGRVVFAELKTMVGKLTVEQEKWLDALTVAGAEVYVWRPDEWLSGEIERVLR